MKVNYKSLYLALKNQKKDLEEKLYSTVTKSNDLPEDFNQNGWTLTIEKLDELKTKLEYLQSIKGNLLTPQFYRPIFNRAIIALNESEKLIDKLSSESLEIDFEQEVTKLNKEIVELQQQLSEKQ